MLPPGGVPTVPRPAEVTQGCAVPGSGSTRLRRTPSPRIGSMDTTLGAFLQSRRARIQPEEVGLPPYGRRRVPGLRREEVAQLAGVSVDYYIRLEQGRGKHVSDAVLDAVARVLQLDP